MEKPITISFNNKKEFDALNKKFQNINLCISGSSVYFVKIAKYVGVLFYYMDEQDLTYSVDQNYLVERNHLPTDYTAEEFLSGPLLTFNII
jgi:hypothetical protein